MRKRRLFLDFVDMSSPPDDFNKSLYSQWVDVEQETTSSNDTTSGATSLNHTRTESTRGFPSGIQINDTFAEEEEMDEVYDLLCSEELPEEPTFSRVYGVQVSKVYTFAQHYNAKMKDAEYRDWIVRIAKTACHNCVEYHRRNPLKYLVCEPIVGQGNHTRCVPCSRRGMICSWRDEYRKEVLMKKLVITEAEYETLLRGYLEDKRIHPRRKTTAAPTASDSERPTSFVSSHIPETPYRKPPSMLQPLPIFTPPRTSHRFNTEDISTIEDMLNHMIVETDAIFSSINIATLEELQVSSSLTNIASMLKQLKAALREALANS
ncbi:hypothetical protein VNI00_004162 [Paramarasmius palmivorus]|uniref:Uncharacterized protein n=1 Tax=Paramarasmius palmivorus TaxID=297713 RepID=A0AAW0DMW3_9AGAR